MFIYAILKGIRKGYLKYPNGELMKGAKKGYQYMIDNLGDCERHPYGLAEYCGGASVFAHFLSSNPGCRLEVCRARVIMRLALNYFFKLPFNN